MNAHPKSLHSPVEHTSTEAGTPATAAQRRLWFLAQMRGADEACHVPVVLELDGALDRDALLRALGALVERHEVLRTRLVTVAGAPYQQVDPAGAAFPLSVRDLTGQPDAEARLAELEREAASAPFDLAVDHPVRGCLVVRGEDAHVLLLTFHQAALDTWSAGVVGRELGQLYAAFGTAVSGDGGEPLTSLPMRYADYAVEQRQWLESGVAERQGAYWAKALAGAPALLELPTDRPRPAEQDFRGSRVPVRLDAELSSAVAAFGRRAGCGVAEVVLAGWALVLARHSGQDDVVIGMPHANRPRPELAGLVGHFAHPLALRVDLSGDPDGQALAGRVREAVRSASDHAELPFERVVDLVKPPRSLGRPPVFQVFFDWRAAERGDGPDGWALPGVDVASRRGGDGTSVYDMALELGEADGRIEGTLTFASALFDAGTAERYVRHLRRVLEQLADGSGRALSEVTLLDAEERAQVLVAFNDSGLPTGSAGLVERFEAQVRERPGQTAVVHRGERLDYAALGRRADLLARTLTDRGVGVDRVVGLHTELSVDMVVGILGVLKAGGAYLPLDPALPAERLAGMVADSGAVLVLSNAAGAEEASGGAPWVSLADAEAGALAEGGAEGGPGVPLDAAHRESPGLAARPEDLAYVIYTSGSTGRPKGVAATHRGILNLLDYWLHEFGAAPGLPSAMWPSFSFDASVQEFLLPLSTGGVLHLVPQDVRDDPEALVGWMREHAVVDVLLPPAYVKWICEAPEERLDGLALRCVRTGLQPLPEESLYRMEQALPGLRVFNAYGPTETALYCTSYLEPRPLARQAPIGRPVANTRAYVLDERREPVPIGVTGELYIGGAGLARGYLNSPGLTDERFVANPFVPGTRMYRSGDLVRWLPGGDLMYVGRRDHQIKLRGFRVELGEIEATLLAQPGVTEAAVLTDLDAGGEPYLVAAVGTDSGSGADSGSPADAGAAVPRDAAAWKAALARRLPSHMIPAFYVELPHLPQTPNGKLDRTAVLELSRAARPAQVNQESPRDHIELTLYQIWQRLLLHPDIGIRDSFFDIGGTSVSAIKLAHAVRAEFGRSLPVRDILLHPTIEDLGGLLRREATDAPPSGPLTFRQGDGSTQVVCVHPAGGTAFCYLSLAKALPDSVGVHGIQSPGVNPGETFLPTVEAMADAYLELVGPLLDADRPLVLTGLSYGGLVAHEMGRRLAEQGQRALSVVLLDTPGTDDPQERAAVVPAEMAEFRDKLVKFNGMYPGIDDAQIEQYFRLYNHNRLTTVDHVPAVTTARTVLMQAVEGVPEEQLREHRAFWQRRTDGTCEVVPARCGHWDMLESAEVVEVAATIGAELARWARSSPVPEQSSVVSEQSSPVSSVVSEQSAPVSVRSAQGPQSGTAAQA
ncbi:amino acid adenylation domain-containing protein [Streptomyces sp. NBC_00237]|uniref:non-ribosomal peptide synthetase n=1 Tax=Streptomyces sp. NBC_00237 TaxID=2975687 RepID=UPI00224F24EE|nr:amino acid adenylation domain-containing protein [Streptomyces sp. NBC_00237]MCX5202738.1 amino acid adenylation domain-containing protein [Streptomyces sp. NBC_00237]